MQIVSWHQIKVKRVDFRDGTIRHQGTLAHMHEWKHRCLAIAHILHIHPNAHTYSIAFILLYTMVGAVPVVTKTTGDM